MMMTIYGRALKVLLKKPFKLWGLSLLAIALSCLFAWMPGLQTVSAGISIVICTVAAAAICAWLFPIDDEEVAQ